MVLERSYIKPLDRKGSEDDLIEGDDHSGMEGDILPEMFKDDENLNFPVNNDDQRLNSFAQYEFCSRIEPARKESGGQEYIELRQSMVENMDGNAEHHFDYVDDKGADTRISKIFKDSPAKAEPELILAQVEDRVDSISPSKEVLLQITSNEDSFQLPRRDMDDSRVEEEEWSKPISTLHYLEM